MFVEQLLALPGSANSYTASAAAIRLPQGGVPQEVLNLVWYFVWLAWRGLGGGSTTINVNWIFFVMSNV